MSRFWPWRSWAGGTRADDEESLARQARAGDAASQYHLALALLYETSRGVDLAEAVAWLRRAADQNHAGAQLRLSRLLREGAVPPADPGEADRWLQRAARGGDPDACYENGQRWQRLSLIGEDAGRIEARIEAYRWFRLASGLGHRDAVAAAEAMNLRMSRTEIFEGERRMGAGPSDRLAA